MDRIRKGDTVVVISGKEKGKRGKVLRVVKKTGRVVVERLMMVKRHTKPTQQNSTGGIIEKEGSIHLSNVMPVDPKTGKPTRVRSRTDDKGHKIRVAVQSGDDLPTAKSE